MKRCLLPKELDNLFSTEEYDGDGGAHVTRAKWVADDLRIECLIRTGNEGQTERWEVRIGGVRADCITSGFADKLELFEEHPLLWPHNQFQKNLYFGHPTERPYELLANIYDIHVSLTKGWIPFDRYLNKALRTVPLCKAANGLFARGPVNVLEAYKEELERHRMNPTIVGGHGPKRWVGEQWVGEPKDLKVLIAGDSYVVGETFEFQKA